MEDWLLKTAYLWSVLLLLPLWLLVFYLRKDLRRKLWHTGRAYGLASVIMGQLFTFDYWNPTYIFGRYFPLEDFLYGLINASLITVLYQFIFKIKYDTKSLASTRRFTLIFASISFVTLYFLIDRCNLNSIYGQICLLLTIGGYTLFRRPDLLKPILINSLFTVVLVFVWLSAIFWIYPSGVTDNWETTILFNIYILGVPIEELFFAFSLGFGGSFFYEVSNGKQLEAH